MHMTERAIDHAYLCPLDVVFSCRILSQDYDELEVTRSDAKWREGTWSELESLTHGSKWHYLWWTWCDVTWSNKTERDDETKLVDEIKLVNFFFQDFMSKLHSDGVSRQIREFVVMLYFLFINGIFLIVCAHLYTKLHHEHRNARNFSSCQVCFMSLYVPSLHVKLIIIPI